MIRMIRYPLVRLVMPKLFKVFFLSLLLLFGAPPPTLAVVNPLENANNRFGIHILEAHDLGAAAALVNSSGGDWGYVTLVLRLNDLNPDKWQNLFDSMRRLKLIPIVRLATVPEGELWVKPLPEDAQKMTDFLNSLNWVITNRYVILFNEPNHAKEWGGQLKPREYVQTVKEFQAKLKAASDDFFILPAGLDTAAPDSPDTMAATEYWRQMYLADSAIFGLFDGWNSHSYPNPNFSAPPTKTGLGSLTSYRSEASYLSQFGLPLNLPLFITETGWVNSAANDLSNYYRQAYNSIWTDTNLVAVTPFVLNYPSPPFSQFSWQEPGTSEFYPHYAAVEALIKTAGTPKQIQESQLIASTIPKTVIENSDYQFQVTLENTGQSIWNRDDYELVIDGNLTPGSVLVSRVSDTEPFDTVTFNVNLSTGQTHDQIILNLQLKFKDQPFGEKIDQTIEVISPPNLIVRAKQFLKSTLTGDDYHLVVYDSNNRVVGEYNLILVDGELRPVKLYGVVPDEVYRLVLLKPYYLPRQTITVLTGQDNLVTFKALLPFDFNNDGQFSWKDLVSWRLFCFWCL